MSLFWLNIELIADIYLLADNFVHFGLSKLERWNKKGYIFDPNVFIRF